MAPVLPCILAGIHWVLGDNPLEVTHLVWVLHSLSVICTYALIVELGKKNGVKAAGFFAIVVVSVIDFKQLYQRTNDAWLLLLGLNWLWLALNRDWDRYRPFAFGVFWGIICGLAVLTNPVLGFCFLMSTVVKMSRSSAGGHREWGRRVSGRRVSMPVAMLLVCGCIVGPWTVRNRVQMGAWVPIKSNLTFEYWLANVIDGDGILDAQSLMNHPRSNSGLRQTFVELGEIGFVTSFGPEARQAAFKLQTLRKMGNRLLAATLWYVPYEAPKTRMESISVGLMRVVYPIPFLCAMFALTRAHVRVQAEFRWALFISVFFLLPFVVVSLYDRYLAPVCGMQMVWVVFALTRVAPTVPDDSGPVS